MWVLVLFTSSVVALLLWLLVSAAEGSGTAAVVFPFIVLAVGLPMRYFVKRWRLQDPRDGRALFELDLDHREQSADSAVGRPDD